MLQRGVAAVEAAFLLIPLVILVLGIPELGRVFYQYNTIVKATRDGVRYLSQMAPGTGHAEAKCIVVTGSPSCDASALVEGLDEVNVTICDAITCPATHARVPSEGSEGVPVMNLVTVTVSGYRSSTLTYVPVPLPSITLDPISATMRQAS